MRPVVGLTCYLEPASWGAWQTRAALIQEWYLDLLRSAGAEVVLLPPGSDPLLVDRIDGLALAGGADVDARRYGHEPHETADAPRTSRDESELALYARARKRGIPVLGICRGLQVMAVAHGGALHQHLPDMSELVHRERPGEFVEHWATFAPGSRIATLLGTESAAVNSSHHQAVADPGTLTATGWAEDGTIEVCEDPSADFVLGVQWHPERPEDREVQLRIARAFVEAAVTGA